MKRLILFISIVFYGISTMAQTKQLKIAGLQMEVTKNIQMNEENIIKYLNSLKDDDIDFLITPEGSLSGYHSSFDAAELNKSLQRVVQAAKKLNIGLVLGTCYKETIDGKEYCYNQARIYTPGGTFLGAYSKILTCSPLQFPGSGEMAEYVQGSVTTFLYKDIRFGVLICNDLWATPGYTTTSNPYLPWKMHQAGAQFLFHIINSGSDLAYRPFHESSASLWARSLKMPIVEVNASKKEKQLNARSGIIGADGERVNNVPDIGEQLFIYNLTIN